MLACSTRKYCDESFTGAKVICRWLFGERFHFYKIPSYSWKDYPLFSTTKEKRCFIAPCEWMKKSKTIWFHTNDSRRFLPTPQIIHLQLLHYMYDQNYHISINSATAYFLVRPFSCFPSTSKQSCICLLMQTRRKWRHIASWTHSDRASSPVKCRVLSRVLSHSHRATPNLNLWLLFISWYILCPGNTAVGKIMK